MESCKQHLPRLLQSLYLCAKVEDDLQQVSALHDSIRTPVTQHVLPAKTSALNQTISKTPASLKGFYVGIELHFKLKHIKD